MMEITTKDGELGLGTSKTMFQPSRKKPCLYIRQNNQVYKIASFNDDEAMENFWRVMVKLGVIKPRDYYSDSE